MEPTTQHKPCSKCNWRLGEHPSEKAVAMHKIRMHGKGWETGQNFRKPKKDGRTGRAWIPGQLERFRASMAKRKRLKARVSRSNGVLPPVTQPEAQPTDSITNAAQAIILAAQVLRSVEVGMGLVLRDRK